MTQSRLRQLIIAFWVFIGGMLLWQFYDFNSKMTQQAVEHPTQTQFIFLHTNAPAAAISKAHSDNAEIEQTGFVVQQNTPGTGSFTCLVTIKNVGHAKATDIQVCVRPYRGTSNYDEDVGHQNVNKLADDDPLSLFNDWLPFPDLAPGESATQPVIFTSRTDARPGENPTPQIIFNTDKSAPATPATPPAPAPTPAPDATPATPSTHHGAEN